MAQLDKLFPGVYSKSEDGVQASMVVQFETELSNWRHIRYVRRRRQVSHSSLSSVRVNEQRQPATKLCVKEYDLIQDETRGTNPHEHYIASVKLAILGASPGEKNASNMSKSDPDTGSDSVIACIGIHIVPKTEPNTTPPISVFTSILNLLALPQRCSFPCQEESRTSIRKATMRRKSGLIAAKAMLRFGFVNKLNHMGCDMMRHFGKMFKKNAQLKKKD